MIIKQNKNQKIPPIYSPTWQTILFLYTVISNETWVSKENSTIHAVLSYDFTETTSSRKTMMVSVLWNQKCVQLVDFMVPRTTTITTATFCQVSDILKRAIQNRRHGCYRQASFLSNSRSHTAHLTTENGWGSILTTFCIVQI